MTKRKFKHTQKFETKAQLRADLAAAWSSKNNLGYQLKLALQELSATVVELGRARTKIINDGFLVDELRKQVAQQHMLLAARREDARAAGARWAQPRQAAPVDPELAAAIEEANGSD